MSKDRTIIAKGVPRNRWLIEVDDKKDKKRILYYDSKGRAESGFKDCGFYHSWLCEEDDMEAVEVEIIIKEITDGKDT